MGHVDEKLNQVHVAYFSVHGGMLEILYGKDFLLKIEKNVKTSNPKSKCLLYLNSYLPQTWVIMRQNPLTTNVNISCPSRTS